MALQKGAPALAAERYLEGIVEAAPEAAPAEVALALEGLEPEARVERLTGFILDTLADVLSLRADQLDPEVKFLQLGLESLTALEMAARIERGLGIALNPTLIETHDSPALLAAALVKQLFPEARREAG